MCVQMYKVMAMCVESYICAGVRVGAKRKGEKKGKFLLCIIPLSSVWNCVCALVWEFCSYVSMLEWVCLKVCRWVCGCVTHVWVCVWVWKSARGKEHTSKITHIGHCIAAPGKGKKRKIKSVFSVHFLGLVLLFDEHKNRVLKVSSDLLLGPPYKNRVRTDLQIRYI